MKSRKTASLIASIVFALSLTACDNKHGQNQETAQSTSDDLSDASAKATIDRALNTTTTSIIGIQEDHQNNQAQAKVQFNNLQYHSGGEAQTYSGTADALFVHYTNGKWMLTFLRLNTNDWDTHWTLNEPVQ